MAILVNKIKWDEVDYDETDIEVINQFKKLPTECELDLDNATDEQIEDYLCNTFGWAVSTFDFKQLNK